MLDAKLASLHGFFRRSRLNDMLLKERKKQENNVQVTDLIEHIDILELEQFNKKPNEHIEDIQDNVSTGDDYGKRSGHSNEVGLDLIEKKISKQRLQPTIIFRNSNRHKTELHSNPNERRVDVGMDSDNPHDYNDCFMTNECFYWPDCRFGHSCRFDHPLIKCR